MLKKSLLPWGVVIFSAALAPAFAADQHEGDIQPWKTDTQILTNGVLFEGDFGDLGAGLYATDDPGVDIDTAKGAFGAGNLLNFQAVGTLKFWDGSAWVASVPRAERIEITDALGKMTAYNANGVSNPLGVIGKVDASGDLHEHLDMVIRDATDAPGGSVGAYRVELNLFESQANSDTPLSATASPLAIVFNRGLEQGAFEIAVAASLDIDLNAAFDAGILSIQRVGVKALKQQFQVQLELQGDRFVLTTATALDTKVHDAQLAIYELTEDLVIPRVKAGGKYYKAVLHNVGDYTFQLISADEIK